MPEQWDAYEAKYGRVGPRRENRLDAIDKALCDWLANAWTPESTHGDAFAAGWKAHQAQLRLEDAA